MMALLSLLVCLSANPVVCETVTPDYAHVDTGQPPTFHECLGVQGQVIAQQWLAEHPDYKLGKIMCSVSNDVAKLRERVESPEA